MLAVVGMQTLISVVFAVQLMPVAPVEAVRSGGGKNRKRVNPVLLTPPATPDPLAGAYLYCNTPNRTQQTWEGHSPADYQLLSVQVMIRHGDRYPLYSIPRTKKPPIDCILSPNKKPSHPLLSSFIAHMGKDGQENWDASLTSLPRLPNHSACEMGELTQTGVVQHLRNGQLLRGAYLRGPPLLPASLGSSQVLLETTGKSRTLQSGLALLYGLLPGGHQRSALRVRQHWNALFCGRSCDCPARQRHLEAEQRRQYRLRVADTRLDRAYVAMAAALGVSPRAIRAANPVDALLCHLCHGLPFPCRVADGNGDNDSNAFSVSAATTCLTPAHLAEIRRQQEEDERERRGAGLYHRYAVLAAQPYLERCAARMERVARGNLSPTEPLVTLASAHDITLTPVLSALGLEGVAAFPGFAARLVMELWRRPPPAGGGARDRETERGRDRETERGRELKGRRSDDLFVRVLYNGEDLTFHTAFCRTHPRHTHTHTHTPLCPLGRFLRFVRGEIFSPLNATSYQEACHASVP
ncbi:2-phosphoxylose phosphatase 1 isoform X2 [Clupea harengus]|uniref:2-phosphoxylose phosphatase 1 n=1 Tax=Clupea harengus TaxID=7950 RepID=A0A6P8FNZ4_CLUHA|nr:2-phosphoxylose phosphatase 1 isoform X2 [Clupea harengus]